MADVHVAAQWDAAFEDHLFNDVLRRVAPHLPDTPPTGLREPDTAEEIAEAAEFTRLSCRPCRRPLRGWSSTRIFI
jgi:hypothetical protein